MKKMLLFLFANASISLYSQTTVQQAASNYFKPPSLVPSAPNVATIEKFGNIPVNYFTGATSVAIPLYTIKCGDISWPFSLSYHSGGFKVEEMASNAGLGWAVVGESVITRAVAGTPDEELTGEPDFSQNLNMTLHWFYAKTVLAGQADSELDTYSYNINGRSGKFIIKQNGDIFQIPRTDLKITKDANGFVIVDEIGNIYTFYQKTNAYTFGKAPYVSTWQVTKVQTPDKKQSLDFTYINGGSSNSTSLSYTQAIRYIYLNDGFCNYYAGTEVDSNPIEAISTSGQYIFHLSRVDFPNGYMTFEYASRTDIPSTNRLVNVKVHQASSKTLLKQFELYQSYFSPGTKLKLDSVVEKIPGNVSAKTYALAYNNIEMPAVTSKAQDLWGFYNGVSTNQTLLNRQTVLNRTNYYLLGEADRKTDTSKMKAGMLTSISWPTGGKTDFTYDVHEYAKGPSSQTYHTESAQASGNGNYTSVTTFVYPGSFLGQIRLNGTISRFNYPSVTQSPYVQLKDLTTGNVVFSAVNYNPESAYEIDQSIMLEPGRNYEITATVFTSSEVSTLHTRLGVSWWVLSGAVEGEKGAGIRVRQIKDYSSPGVVARTQYFEYGMGWTATPYHDIKTNVADILYRMGYLCHGDGSACLGATIDDGGKSTILYSSSIFPISSVSGSPVLYPMVTRYELDATGASKGKTVYEYEVFQDEGLHVLNRYKKYTSSSDWKNGNLKKETHYSRSGSSYTVVKQIENTYTARKLDTTYNLSIVYKYVPAGCTDYDGAAFVDAATERFKIPILTGVIQLSKSVQTEYSNGVPISNVTHNFYDDAVSHILPTKTCNINSKGDTITTFLKYPVNFTATGNPYSKMIAANIISPVIESKTYKGFTVSPTLLSTIKTSYKDWKSDGLVVAPDTVKSSFFNNPLESKLVFIDYNDRKQPLELKKDGDKSMAYIYDYNYQHVIAEVTNATQAHIAYTSFEGEGKGNWSYSGNPVRDFTSPTGKWCYPLGGVSKSGLSSSTTYIVSYWKKSGTVNVHSTTPVTGRTANGWTYYEHRVTGISNLQITGSGTTYIDELRLYPASNALMTTYTYEPLVGMISQCDANNRISSYEYDELQRLVLIRDQDKNVVKKFAYNYAGRPEYPNVYYNVAKSGTYQKTNCTGCVVGDLVTYTVPAGSYLSAVSQVAADQMAQNDVNANGLAYANANGNCISPPFSTVTVANAVPVEIIFYNTCTGVSYNRTLNGTNTNFPFSTIPQGIYNISITAINNPTGNYNFSVNGYTSYGGSYAYFGYITLGPGSSTNNISVAP